MDQPFTVYGQDDDRDTGRVCDYLRERGVKYQYVDVNEDDDAHRFVVLLTGGDGTTPVIAMGPEDQRITLTNPSNEELGRTLDSVGYTDPFPDIEGRDGNPERF